MTGLTLQQLRFQYPDSSLRLHVPSLTIQPQQAVALLGSSGAGKTTLLRLMAGLLRPTSGEILWDGKPLSSLNEGSLRRFRLHELGLIFQDFALLNYLTVAENLLLPTQFQHQTDSKEAKQHARELAEQLQINAHWQRPVAQLSQGERQRVAIARALVHRPHYLFADEPTASLDTDRRNQVMELLQEYVQKHSACLVMVTHDVDLLPLFPEKVHVEVFHEQQADLEERRSAAAA